jgi:predicted nucleotidyltransferase
MIGKNQAIDIIKQFIEEELSKEEWFRAIKPDIKATLLYGSVARGTNREDSDIDILIILPLSIEEQHTTGEYFYDYHGHQMNIVLRSIERIRKVAEENNDKMQKEVFDSSVIISSSDGEVKKLLAKISEI